MKVVMTDIDQATAHSLYTRGNSNGEGYAPYTDDVSDDTIEAAVDAAIADGAEVVLYRHSSSEIVVLLMADGGLLGIGGEANGRGAWAVPLYVTRMVP